MRDEDKENQQENGWKRRKRGKSGNKRQRDD